MEHGNVTFERGSCSAREPRRILGLLTLRRPHRYVGETARWGPAEWAYSEITGTCSDCGDRYRAFGLADAELRSFHAVRAEAAADA